MFEFSLSDSLKYVQNKNDYQAVLACLIGERLAELCEMDAAETYQAITRYYAIDSDNYNIIQDAILSDSKNEYPIFYCCYALITHDIQALDADKLDLAIGWLQEEVSSHPEYNNLLKSLVAIADARAYTPGDKLTLPANCYLNLAHASLPEVDLSHACLPAANFTGANLEQANFTGATLNHAVFVDADLVNANFSHAVLEYANCSNANMRNGKFNQAFMRKADLLFAAATDADFSDAALVLANLTGADLSNSTFKAAKICRAILDSASFCDADLSDASLDLASLQRANFTSANLTNCLLRSTDLFETNFSRANASHADFASARMQNTRFDATNLQSASLQQVACHASFENANLNQADIRHADLSGLDMTMRQATMADIVADSTTRFAPSHANMLSSEYERHAVSKRAALLNAKIEFFTNDQLKNKDNLIAALDHFHECFKSHHDHALIQKCIMNNFIEKVMQMQNAQPTRAALLRDAAYEHPFFEHDNKIAQLTNAVSKSIYGLFAENQEHPEEALIESDCQTQLRTVLGNV